MKRCYSIAIVFLVLAHLAVGQLYQRGKKNFYIEPSAALNFSNARKSSLATDYKGVTYGIGGGKIFEDRVRVGLQYNHHDQRYTTEGEQVNSYRIVRNTASAKADLMLSLFKLYLGKSKHYECMSVTSKLMFGPEYAYNFGSNNIGFTCAKGEALLNASYGLLFKKSGSSKRQAGYDLYLTFNMKKGISSFSKLNFNGQKLYGTYWGVSLMLVKYKTGKWN